MERSKQNKYLFCIKTNHVDNGVDNGDDDGVDIGDCVDNGVDIGVDGADKHLAHLSQAADC
eukprot:9922762-Ditylum_brightwellii.AAC.1